VNNANDSQSDNGWIKHPTLWRFAEQRVAVQGDCAKQTPTYWLKVKEEYEKAGGVVVAGEDADRSSD
jgi:hypothetical protein